MLKQWLSGWLPRAFFRIGRFMTSFVVCTMSEANKNLAPGCCATGEILVEWQSTNTLKNTVFYFWYLIRCWLISWIRNVPSVYVEISLKSNPARVSDNRIFFDIERMTCIKLSVQVSYYRWWINWCMSGIEHKDWSSWARITIILWARTSIRTVFITRAVVNVLEELTLTLCPTWSVITALIFTKVKVWQCLILTNKLLRRLFRRLTLSRKRLSRT